MGEWRTGGRRKGGVPDPVYVTNDIESPVIVSSGVSADEDGYLSSYLLNGASEDMAVNGVAVNVEFGYTVPANMALMLERSFLVLEDGVTEFSPGNFGQIAGALANGVQIGIIPLGGVKVTLENWATNREVRITMFDFDNQFKTAGSYVGRWTFARDMGVPFMLTAGDRFSILIQDDLSPLDYMALRIKGLLKAV